MRSSAAATLLEYADEHLFTPKPFWSRQSFRYRSYSRWALDEIVYKIVEQESRPSWSEIYYDFKTPAEIISEFIDQMDFYAESSTNGTSIYIFSVARDTAEEIRELFM
jgi:hypothetical protein